MKIGCAQRCITPKLPVLMAGYAKERVAEGVLDDIFIKVILCHTINGIIGVLSYDVCAIDHLLIDQVKEGMKKLQLQADQFLFTATHTHAGPGGLVDTSGILKPATDVFIETNPDLIGWIAEESLLALQEAMADCKESIVSYAQSKLEHIGSNRNDPTIPGNDDLLTIFIEQQGGGTLMINLFACHPTILNAANKMISADLPGAIQASMKQHNYHMCMYVNGSCGDISTRFTRQCADAGELARYGKLFEKKLITMKQKATLMVRATIRFDQKQYSLKLKEVDSLEQAESNVQLCEHRLQKALQKGISTKELRLLQSYKEGSEANLRLAMTSPTKKYDTITITFIQFHDHIVVCIPGEVFSSLSNPLQDERVHFIGYANGYVGYFADQHAYDSAYYEAMSSPFERGESEKMMLWLAEEINKRKRKDVYNDNNK